MKKDISDDPVYRRFGRDWDKPCNRPSILTCAQWPCQEADKCQAEKPPAAEGRDVLESLA